MSLNCTTCGACCTVTAEGDHVRVTEGEAKSYVHPGIRDKLLELPVSERKGPVRYTFKIIRDRCCFLKGTVGRQIGCTIYDHRPSSCVAFQVGSLECHERRRLRGLE